MRLHMCLNLPKSGNNWKLTSFNLEEPNQQLMLQKEMDQGIDEGSYKAKWLFINLSNNWDSKL